MVLLHANVRPLFHYWLQCLITLSIGEILTAQIICARQSWYICEVMMWAIKRELTLVEVDTGKSLLHRAKLRHFVVPLVLVTSCVDKEVVPIETEGPFPITFINMSSFVFSRTIPAFTTESLQM